MSTEITINQDQIDINVDTTVVTIEAPQGGYPLPNNVYSVFGRVGNVVAQEGDYTLTQLGGVTITSPIAGQALVYNGTSWVNNTETYVGTVTSVDMSVPTGFTIGGNPITTSGTLALGLAAGYSVPTDANQTNWTAAYNDKINSASVTGTTTKTLTLNQQDGGTITATWSDYDTGLTSVGLTMPTAFTVSNSPLTSNGTIAVTAAGTGSQYIKGDGTLATFPTTIQQAQRLITEVYNSTGATLSKGTIVYINGGQGNLPTVTKAIATGDATSAQTYGVVQSDITNNNNGYVVVLGSLTDLDTQAYAVGTQLYLSGTTAGEWTSTKPYAPIHLVYVGIVVRSHPSQGVVEVRIQNGYELDELHDVSAQNPTNGDILQYVAATDLWTKTAGTTTNIAEGTNLYYTQARFDSAFAGKSTTNLTEGTNLYYTDARSRAAFSESVTGLDYNSTTGVLSTTSGYGIPTTASQATWNTAYNDSIVSAGVTGTTTKTLTLNQQDGGTITASWTDDNTDAVTSVFGRTGAVVATSGDYNTSQVTENTNLYFTNTRARAAISETVTGLDYDNTTGVLSTTAGYGIPTTASQTNWDTAYTNRITSTSAPLSIASNAISISQANTTTDGYLSSTDWNTFNNKQAAGNYITALTGEATASGPGSASVTLTNSAVIGKVLTGLNVTGGTVIATDSILDAFGKVQNQINGLIGGSIYQGVWNASTNTPTLTSSVGTKGYYYIVNVSGTTNLNGITDWQIGDWAIYDGTAWQKVDNTDSVSSVNGFTGAVSLTTSNISEGTNLYFTNTRAQDAITLTTTGTSGAATYSGGTLNIPQYQGVLTNPVTGTGTTNTLPKFTGASTIGNSNVTDTGSLITLGSDSIVSNGSLEVSKNDRANGALLKLTNSFNGSGWIAGDIIGSLEFYSSDSSAIGTRGAIRSISEAGSTNSSTTGLSFETYIGALTSQKMYLSGAGNLGIGTTTLSRTSLSVSKNVTGSTIAYSVLSDGIIQSDVTSQGYYFTSVANTAAASFTLGSLYHYRAIQGTFGAGSSVTTQVGFYVDGLTGATTNNYGFFGGIASGTGRYNLFMNGTADNYLAGSLGIGSVQVNGGPILTITLTSGGSGYVDGTYTDVAMTGGGGQGALATFVVSGGIVTTATLTWGGANYIVGGLLSASNANLGGTGSGLSITIATVDSSQFSIGSANGADITLFRNDTTLSVNDNIGTIKWMSNDTTIKASGLAAEIGAFGESTNGGAYLSFLTRSGTAGTSLVEAMRIGGSGGVGIGTVGATLTGYVLRVSRAITGSISSFGIRYDGDIKSNVTTSANLFYTQPTTEAATFTLTSINHFAATQGTFGAGSTITNQYGFIVANSLIGATNNYGFFGNIAAGTNRWNLYMAGTAANYMAGNTGIGTTTVNSFLNIGAGTTAKAQINLATSVAPTTPNDGDIWFDGTAIKVRVAGVTRTIAVV